MDIKEMCNISRALHDNIARVIVGKDKTIDLVIIALLAGGHVLLEDHPGTGKTTLAKAFAKSIQGDFKRVQFTPDLLPSDITGLNVYNQKTSEFSLVKGPVFTNVLLADEINRAAPRTQSSLLEAMEERQVTIDGETMALNAPFVVFATENPIETVGTYPLPEAQLDRFIMKLDMEENDRENELAIIDRYIEKQPLRELEAVCDMHTVSKMQEMISGIFVHRCVREYIVDIVMETRESSMLSAGVSSRGTLALVRCCQARAAIQGRRYAEPEDVIALAPYVLGHRVITFGGANHFKKNCDIIRRIVSDIAVPVENWEM